MVTSKQAGAIGSSAIALVALLLGCTSQPPDGGGTGGNSDTGGAGGNLTGGAGETGGWPLPNCPPDWEPRAETGRCYRSLSLDFDECVFHCNELGGSLVVPTSDAEFELVVIKLCPYNSSCWLAATDRETEGVFKWSDGSPVVFPEGIEWAPGEPDDDTQPQEQDCLAAEEELMVDRYCANGGFGICVRDPE